MRLPAAPAREPRPPQPWPDWAELVPGVIWIDDVTHVTTAGRCTVAVLDVVSRTWLSTVVSAEESSTQVEVAFTRALTVDGTDHLLEDSLPRRAALRSRARW
jgi:putative transposase